MTGRELRLSRVRERSQLSFNSYNKFSIRKQLSKFTKQNLFVVSNALISYKHFRY